MASRHCQGASSQGVCLGTAALATLVGCLLLTPTGARSQPDYALDSPSWNGLARFLALARETGATVETPQRVSLWALSSNDAIVVIYPTQPLPLLGLTAFMRAGGRLAIIDDFGASEEMLHAYKIGRHRPSTRDGSRRLRNNENLLVARPSAPHPLAQGVVALVANHPRVLYHSELKPIFSLSERRNALVLAGAVGEGRLVVAGDASILINNMLQFRGNQVFAKNLVQYLTGGASKRLLVVVRDVPILERYGTSASGHPLETVRHGLERLSRTELPRSAIRTLTFVLCAVLLLALATALPRHSPYADHARMFMRPCSMAGFTGRLRFFGRHRQNLLQPLMVFKFELEPAIAAQLGLSGRPLSDKIIERMRALDIPEKNVAELQLLLRDLRDLHERRDSEPTPPRIRPGQFHNMVSTGIRALALIREKTHLS